MNFVANTKEELQQMHLIEDLIYDIEYVNRDYFNGEDTLEVSKAKLLLNDGDYIFVVTDPYGMDKFIKEVRVLR